MKRIIASVVVCLVLNPVVALASNDWFMYDTPAGNFTADDTTIFSASVDKALNNTPSGKKLTWKNPKTGAWGYVLPLNAYMSNGTKCREAQIYNEAKGFTNQSRYKFCKMSGEWKIVN